MSTPVIEVQAADFGGVCSADVDRLEQHSVAEPVEGDVLARPCDMGGLEFGDARVNMERLMPSRRTMEEGVF
ncbi:hypothetical protein ACOZ38_22715 [Sphaerisporangium viridialbum]|uniref:hypothetical protein n=1 Tax=Sphaerisporangium viridialbum TaxID=46189 RepID=UPI003C72A31A